MRAYIVGVVLAALAGSPALADFQSLLNAAREDNLVLARQLLEQGSPPDGDSSGFSRSYTPLQWASRRGNLALAQLLLAEGARVDQRDFNGDRALLWAADAGKVEVVRLLLAAGAVPQSLDDPYHRTPLMVAAGGGHAEVIRVLLEAGADPTTRDQSGDSALHYAAMWGGVDAVRALLQSDATDANPIESILQRTPLWYAGLANNAEMVELLIRAGARSRVRDSDGMTVLLSAANAGRAAAVAKLALLGADREERDPAGATPLLLAITSGSAETVAALRNAGADPGATDAEGRGIEHYLALVRTSLPSRRVPPGSRAASFEPDWDAIAADIAEKQAAIRLVLGLDPA
jgi:ankyrin repeat protein